MTTIDRRRALFIFGWVAGAVATAEAAWATLRFAKAPVSYGPPRRWSLGPAENFAAGAAVYDEQAGVFVKRDGDGLRAMSAACTHLGCTVRRHDDGFVCPCHGSRYDHDSMGDRPFEQGPIPRLDARDQPVVAFGHRARHEQGDGGGNERQ